MKTRQPRTPLIVAGLIAALGLGIGLGATAIAVLGNEPATIVRQVTVSDSEPAVAADGLTIGQIYERASKAVVEIAVTAGGSSFSDPATRAQGSGFVLDRDGHIVTNQHVVSGAGSISVSFWNGTVFAGELVGTDPSTDLAVIKVDARASLLEPLGIGDSNAVAVGDVVLAMGSPFGLEGTVTSGIVSALHRQMTAPNNFTITDTIQTDAAINHGNSGGPLLDRRGRVIGVNAQIESDSGGSDGVGFAIPGNTVRSIARQLIDSGEVRHAYLGITMVAVPGGVAVTKVQPERPAEKAGLRAATGSKTVDGQERPTGGDVIIAFAGVPVDSAAALQSAVDARRPGDEVSITILRDGERRTIEVTLSVRPARPS
ncbi:MAG: trypsin-like peptidase domain-containing protein [Thermoleophilia bacterium]|nr:trypsin-like peptidase domain-containing protein [Thermoleophilia bacterium]MDH4339817.1 trypsin-like peptidase domain-containing protein [Thermoleophilia bacterium]